MNPRQTVLVIDDDSSVTNALSMLLEHDGRTLILCSDVESAELMLARHPVTHVLSDVQFSGPFGFEGLHFLTRIREQRPECRIVLMTGAVTDALCDVAGSLGAASVLAKPFALSELEDALDLDGAAEGAYELLAVPPLDEVLGGGLLSTAFQPIVTLNGAIFGFEALARVEGAWGGGAITELFEYAAKRDRLAELNLAAMTSAIAGARALAGEMALFINVDPMTFDRGDVAGVLRAAAAIHDVPLSRVVLEITERSSFLDPATVLPAIESLRADGVRFALDDHGSAYSHLSLIDRIRPAFIKISPTFGTAFDEDAMRLRVVRNIASLARDFGCRTILEGVESASTARAAAAHGIDLAQGYYFGRPHAASHWVDATRVAA
jgi:EAL domain-containing protein (putative c-di-GMP-specific phosphodiesterase class I)